MRTVFHLLSACGAIVRASSTEDSCTDADSSSLLQSKSLVRKHFSKDAKSERPPDLCDRGEDVLCPDGVTMCAGDQCCPDGSTCPSANYYHLHECQAEKGSDCTEHGHLCDQNRWTGGTCFFSNCFDWRGETECNGGWCLCAAGKCAHEGVCHDQDPWIWQELWRPSLLQEASVNAQSSRQDPVACEINADVPCPDGVTMCAGDQCCPDGSTCPSASPSFDQCSAPKAEGHDCVEEAERQRRVNAQSSRQDPVACEINADVQCPDGATMCAGDQCCPDGSTCPSASPSFDQCVAPKAEGHDCVEEAERQRREAELLQSCAQHTDTGGTCHFFGCYPWRGDTECVNGRCLCAQDGQCAAERGYETGRCVDAHVWQAQ